MSTHARVCALPLPQLRCPSENTSYHNHMTTTTFAPHTHTHTHTHTGTHSRTHGQHINTCAHTSQIQMQTLTSWPRPSGTEPEFSARPSAASALCNAMETSRRRWSKLFMLLVCNCPKLRSGFPTSQTPFSFFRFLGFRPKSQTSHIASPPVGKRLGRGL